MNKVHFANRWECSFTQVSTLLLSSGISNNIDQKFLLLPKRKKGDIRIQKQQDSLHSSFIMSFPAFQVPWTPKDIIWMGLQLDLSLNTKNNFKTGFSFLMDLYAFRSDA